MQHYIARVATTPSVFRNQGPKGTKNLAKTAVAFLAKIDLNSLKNIDPTKYPGWLDARTDELVAQFPVKDLWGSARKALNIFMTMALLNRFMCVEYQLDRLEDLLEVPLDGRVHGQLVRWAKTGAHKPPPPSRSFSIKGLKKGESDQLQEIARHRANHEKVPRGALDVFLWT